MENCGTSVTTPFVLTSSGSCQGEIAGVRERCTHCSSAVSWRGLFLFEATEMHLVCTPHCQKCKHRMKLGSPKAHLPKSLLLRSVFLTDSCMSLAFSLNVEISNLRKTELVDTVADLIKYQRLRVSKALYIYIYDYRYTTIIYIYIYLHTQVCVYIHLSLYISLSLYIYIYIYISCRATKEGQ